ncbi:hypothetical protein Hanom_Chr12g01175271 [Helianthus anomalus]
MLLESQPAITDCMVVAATRAHTTMDSHVEETNLTWMETVFTRSCPFAKFAIDCTGPPLDIISH